METRTATEVLQNKWWIGLVALGASLVATPIFRFIAYHAKIVDKPDQLLKPHGRPVAYLGGLAMCVGYLGGLIALATVFPVGEHWQQIKASLGGMKLGQLMHNPLWNMLGIAVSGVLITLTGLLDDIWELRPAQKVCGQVAAAGVLIVGGIGYRMMIVLLAAVSLPSPPAWLLIPLSSLVCVVMVIATCNATNLLDGLDGLCGGVTGIISLGFLALAVFLAMWPKAEIAGIDELRVGLSLAMAGAVIGFLPYNVPPASIFMGDAGSMLLGFYVATMVAMFCQEGTARWFIAAWVVFALPTLDTALAVVRRLLAGKSIFAGDRSHLYDQLVDRGMTVKQVVVLFYVLAAISAILGVVASIYLRLRYAVILYGVLLAIVWVIFYKLGMVNPPPHEPAAGDADKSSQEG